MDARTLRARSRELVRELGMFAPQCCATPLTPVEAHLLIELESGPLTNNQLAERLRVDKSNTSRPLSRLQERELVIRQPHAVDGRSQELGLTELAGAKGTAVHLHQSQQFGVDGADEFTDLVEVVAGSAQVAGTRSRWTASWVTPRGGPSARDALKRPSPRLEAARYSASRENCTRGGGEGGGTAAMAARTRATGAMYRSLTCL